MVLYSYQVFGEPKPHDFQHAPEFVIRLANARSRQQLHLNREISGVLPDKGFWSVEVVPVFWRASAVTLCHGPSCCSPRFGIGSMSCAGKEKRTFAMSETPMNLPAMTD